MTTAEGGAVLTSSETIDAAVRRFRNHGIVREPGDGRPDWYYEVRTLGMNYRLPDVLCALGSSQLAKLDRFVTRRRALASRYRAALAGLAELSLPEEPHGVESSWHLFVIRVNESARRDSFFHALRAAGLGVQLHYMPAHLHPLFAERGFRAGQFPAAEDFAARAISLPLFPAMRDADADRVIDAVHRAAKVSL